jgi:hypothetical protein
MRSPWKGAIRQGYRIKQISANKICLEISSRWVKSSSFSSLKVLSRPTGGNYIIPEDDRPVCLSWWSVPMRALSRFCKWIQSLVQTKAETDFEIHLGLHSKFSRWCFYRPISSDISESDSSRFCTRKMSFWFEIPRVIGQLFSSICQISQSFVRSRDRKRYFIAAFTEQFTKLLYEPSNQWPESRHRLRAQSPHRRLLACGTAPKRLDSLASLPMWKFLWCLGRQDSLSLRFHCSVRVAFRVCNHLKCLSSMVLPVANTRCLRLPTHIHTM